MKKVKNIVKWLLISILIIILISVIATIGVGKYFVNYAIARSGAGGDREISDENVIVQNDLSSQNIIEQNRQKEKDISNNWASNILNEKVEIKAIDGITLKATKYIVDENENKWAIVLHGYRSNPESVLTIGEHFSNKGYNVLIPSMRACSDSEGEYIGMGWLDKEDLKAWINLIVSQNADAKIILHGSSMGSATVLMTSGDDLPNNVKAIIADSGYTSVWDIFASEAKVRFNLPTFPVLNMFQLVAKIEAGYDIKEASALEQVKNSKTPILFIHGDADDFVPLHMCDKLFEVANCEKDKLIIEGAGHTDAKYKEPETYYNKVFEFIEKYI